MAARGAGKQPIGPRSDWGDWRAKRDRLIKKPRSRKKAVALLEQQNNEAREKRKEKGQ
jgi:hypothetical protein